MGILEIGLTIWAWNRGWRGWSLLPIGMGFVIGFIAGIIMVGAGVTDFESAIVPFIIIDLVVISILIFMVAKPRKKPASVAAWNPAPAAAPTPEPYLRPANPLPPSAIASPTVSYPVAKAKLVLSDRSEITLAGTVRPIGRSDFEKVTSPEALHYISRQHFWIRYDAGKYFAEDSNSANGTRVNGVAIKGKGLQELRDGDRIDVAETATLTFKMVP